jgi:spore germination protein KC
MLFKKILLFIMLMAASACAAGCFDALDINSQALITAVSLEKENDEYVFYVELPNLSMSQSGQEGGGASKEQYRVVRGSGKTLAQARQDLNYKNDKPLFLGTVRVLILTQNVAEVGIEEYMHRMQNDVQYRKAINVITTRVSPKDLLSATPENNVSVGFSIEDTINTLENAGQKIAHTTSDILEYLASDTCFVLPNFDLENDKISCTGYIIIHEGKYCGFIPEVESKGLVWLLGEQAKWTYVIPYEDYEVTVEAKLIKREIKPTYANEKLTLDLEFAFDSDIMYLSKDVSFGDAAQKQVNEALQNMILQDITDTIKKSKQVGCEYLGFKDFFRISYPDKIRSIDWQQTYLDSSINVTVKSKLKPGGLANFKASGLQPKEQGK